MELEFKAYRSKRSGNFFKFEQYHDDGFGEYIDHISLKFDIPYGNLPTLFKKDEELIYNLRDHTEIIGKFPNEKRIEKDVEIVIFKVSFPDLEDTK